MTFTELMNACHSAKRLSIKSGSSNTGISKDLEGVYITVQNGLSVSTYFLGTRKSTGEQVVEFTN
jgi:hypothetical protein